jgi:eukaryotic-like serine/threonine-protein kinase
VNEQLVHPQPQRLAEFALGRLAGVERDEIERHIARCATCCKALGAVPDDTLLGNLRSSVTPASTLGTSAAGTMFTGPTTLQGLPRELLAHPRYRILKLLGKGGMGEVYLAEHRLMRRLVALKVIRRNLTQNPQAIERFRQELVAAGQLAHPNIVAALDAEQAGAVHFLAMEYIEGTSLSRLVEERGRLPVAQTCNYIHQASIGLQHAFDHGMVHRDIKPQNLMVTKQNQIKILDFGLARLIRAANDRITALGAVVGTPDYIAPEQATDSRHADIRADIYSLGCTLYFLLSGQPPFTLGSRTEKVLAHIDTPPPPLTAKRADVPPDLVKVIERMMAKDPAKRPQTPREVAQLLAPFAKLPATEPARADGKPVAKPAGKREPGLPSAVPVALAATTVTAPELKPSVFWRQRHVWVAGMLLLLVSAILVWAFSGGRNDAGENTEGGSDKKKDNPVVAKAGPPRVVMVLPHENFWYPDYGPVREILEKGGMKVSVASSKKTPAKSHDDQRFGGLNQVEVDYLIEDVRAKDFTAVYFAGAMDMEYLGDQPAAKAARQLITDMLADGKIVSGLCNGVAILADAGVLQGKPAARYMSFKRYGIKEDAADWQPQQPVVTADNLITGGDWKHGPLLAETLVKALEKSR